MHVFIDTNILLNFFHYAKDELDSLNDVFASHAHGSATVHLTEQVKNEFIRNREAKISDALRRYKDVRLSPQLPSFTKGYEEYELILKAAAELQKHQKALDKKIDQDISTNNLAADQLIGQIFKTSKITPINDDIYKQATMRMALGNPPGKNGSLGDAVNWTTLLAAVPDGQDLHMITEDADFYSTLDETKPLPFLESEWRRSKKASLFAYRTLAAFMKMHFDGVAFSYDKTKDALIDELRGSGSFAHTHSTISRLSTYSYFSAKEVARILDAACANGQVGSIVTDADISEFMERCASPHRTRIAHDDHKEILKRVDEVQQARRSFQTEFLK